MSKASGRSIPGEEVQEKTDDDALLQMENCIKVLHSVFMQNDNDVCDISSFTEYDMANLMAFIGRYGDAFIGNPVDAGEPPKNWVGPWKKYIKLSDMYDAAYKYFGIDIEGVFEQLSLYKAPKNAKFGWRYDGTVENVNGVECVEVGEQVDAAVFISPCIEKIYSLSDDCSYVLYKYYEDMSESGPKPYTEPLKVLREDKSLRANRGYAIIKNRMENGKKHYYIVQCGLDKKSFLLNSELSRYITSKREASNIYIDYSNVRKFNEINQYIDYLGQILNGVQPNDSAKSEIAEYIEYAIEHCCSVNIKVKGKKLILNRECIEEVIAKADEIRIMFENFLAEKNITLNKKIKIVIRIDSINAVLKKGVTITFDKSLSEIYDKFDSLRIVLDKERQSVYATSSQIKNLIEGETNYIFIKQKDKKYNIDFIGSDGKNKEYGADSITFSFKSESNYDSVFYEKSDNNKINWGGQINDYDDVIEVIINITGEYYVEKNAPEILDISDFSDEEQEAIKFMVSRGFFELTDGAFKPNMSLSRYDFTRVIVSMFYELDFEAECTFDDINSDNGYYSYIASAQKKNTVKGYEDNTFRGDNHTTREEVISIASRTLANKKDYFYPENTEEYVCFVDNENINGWENQYGEIALAVREGLINKGGFLAPQMNITRADAAVILYRLFNLLYDNAPTQMQTAASSSGISFPVKTVAVAGGGAVSLGAVIYIILRKKFLR